MTPILAKQIVDRVAARGLLEPARLDEAEARIAKGEPLTRVLASLGAPAGAADAFADASLEGRTIARFRLDALLGCGGMGAVYRARQMGLDRDVAVKVIDARNVSEASEVERFRREAKAACKLDHPHVVAPIDFGEEGPLLYYAMELAGGGTAERRLLERGPLPEGEVLELLESVARALDAAGEHGLVHRDVKPANIFYTSQGVVKLGDLGLALDRGASRLTGGYAAIGTPVYMAPEQALAKPLEAKADVYALGVAAWELLAGAPPFTGADPVAVVAHHLRTPPPDVRSRRKEVSDGTSRLLLRMMAKDPHARPTPHVVVETVVELRAVVPTGRPIAPRSRGGLAVDPDAATARPLAAPKAMVHVAGASGVEADAATAKPVAAAGQVRVEGAQDAAPEAATAKPGAPPPPPASGPFRAPPAAAAPTPPVMPKAPPAREARLPPPPPAPSGSGSRRVLLVAVAPLVLGLVGAVVAAVLSARAPAHDEQAEARAASQLRTALLERRDRNGDFGETRGEPADPWVSGQCLEALVLLEEVDLRRRLVPDIERLPGLALLLPSSAFAPTATSGAVGFAGYPYAIGDTVPCVEATAAVGRAVALSFGRVETEPAPLARKILEFLLEAQAPSGAFATIPELGDDGAMTSATTDAISAICALARALGEEKRALPAVERAADWLASQYDSEENFFPVNPRRVTGAARQVPGLDESCALALLEARALARAAGVPERPAARKVLEAFASHPTRSGYAPDTVGAAVVEDYRFQRFLPPGQRTTAAEFAWLPASWRLVLAQELAQDETLPRREEWAIEAARLRALFPKAPELVRDVPPTWKVAEALMGLALVRAAERANTTPCLVAVVRPPIRKP